MLHAQPQIQRSSQKSKSEKGQGERERLTLKNVARAALKKADGDMIEATEIMKDRILNNERLYRALMDPLVKNACYEQISSVVRQSNRVKWETAQPNGKQQRTRLAALARGSGNSLLNIIVPLTNGKKLKDVIKADCERAADFCLKHSKSMAIKGGWFRLIAKQLPDERKKVGQVLDATQLAKLQEKATNSV